MADLYAVVGADPEHDRVEDAGRVASDDLGGHALEWDGPLELLEPLGLLADDGLLPEPNVLKREPVVLGLEAGVVVAQAVDLADRGRKAVTGGADVGKDALHRDEELGQEGRRAADDVGVTRPQQQQAGENEQCERPKNAALGTTCATEACHAETLTRVR